MDTARSSYVILVPEAPPSPARTSGPASQRLCSSPVRNLSESSPALLQASRTIQTIMRKPTRQLSVARSNPPMPDWRSRCARGTLPLPGTLHSKRPFDRYSSWPTTLLDFWDIRPLKSTDFVIRTFSLGRPSNAPESISVLACDLSRHITSNATRDDSTRDEAETSEKTLHSDLPFAGHTLR